MNKILAIVVSYNRKELLKENLEALKKQTYKEFDILIVDNASTDGTKEFISEYIDNKKVFYKNTEKNIGGAGGFNIGMKEAMLNNYDYAWIMDDDTIPKREALKSIINKKEIIKEKFSFICSLAKFNKNTLCIMNKPVIEPRWIDEYEKIKNNLIWVESCSFVSCFINLKYAKMIGLPIKEFFIYGDDVEYTLRLSKKEKGYIDLDSIVDHKMQKNTNTNIIYVEKERVGRSFYTVRNRFFIAKKTCMKATVKYILKNIWLMVKVLFKSKDARIKRQIIIIKGLLAGIIFNPKIEKIDKI